MPVAKKIVKKPPPLKVLLAGKKAKKQPSKATKETAEAVSTFNDRWHPALKKAGFAQVSVFFLRNYHLLQPDLTHGQAMFVVHLMQYKWDAEAPFPAYKTIATQMRVSIKTARRFAQELQGKGYLHREMRRGTTNRFHLNRLMTALVDLQTAQREERRKQRPRHEDE